MSNGSSESGGGSSDAGLSGAQQDANTCFGPGPVGGVVPVPCPPPPGNLTVVVTDAQTKAPIPGANVQIQGPQNSSGTSDASGTAQFPGISPGSYTANATKAGYTTGNASATVASGATTTANISLQKIVLEIVDMKTGTVVSGTAQTKIVGQKVQLQVRTNPLGQAMTNIQWTIPGDRVKNYTQSTGSGVKTDLAAADLQGTSITFFWINGGNNNVQVTAQVAGTTLNASATYNVLRPTVDHFTTATSGVNICVSNYITPGTWLAAYQPTPPAKAGNQWDAKVTAPAGGDGQIGLTQLINVNRTRTTNAGLAQIWSSGGAFVLDDGLGIQYSGAQAIAASASATLSGGAYSDSPATPLTGDLSAKTAADSFHLYLMFKSSEAGSIWVTLSTVNWNWGGQTTRTGAPAANTWSPATGTSLASDANGADSTELPTWTRAYSSISWV
jgi:hypothetical protein